MARSKSYEAKVNILQGQIAEIIAKVDLETRIEQSKARVKVLKSIGAYPKVAVTTTASRRRGAWE